MPRGTSTDPVVAAAQGRMSRVLRFAAVGGIGFLADAAMLAALLAATPAGPFLARLLSIGLALIVTWQLNRQLTFGPSSRGLLAEGTRYGSIGVFSSIANYLAYSALLLAIPGLPPLAALVFASLAVMALSYVCYSRLVFDR